MKLTSIIQTIVWRFTWRNKLCPRCSNLEVVGNYSPCYQCKLGCNYEELDEVLNNGR